MGWLGRLELQYALQGGKTIAHDLHEGPLRVLQRLYPEGEAVCHHVLVHPPGGIAGGDSLEVDLRMAPGTHALVTTPGATRFYRSSGEPAVQRAHLHLEAGARLEWLPLETLAYDGCLGENALRLELADSAQAMGWDTLALGLPAAGAPFLRGSFLQHLEWPGHWLERGCIEAADTALLDSPLGWAGQRVLGTLWFAWAGAATAAGGGPLREALTDAAREVTGASPLAPWVGVTSPHEGLVLLRVLAQRVEPVMALLVAVRAAWRAQAWGLAAHPPRIWST